MQLLEHLGGTLGSLLWIALKQAVDDIEQRLGQPRVRALDSRCRVANAPVEERLLGSVPMRNATGDASVKHHTDRVEVASHGGLLALQKLRRSEIRSTRERQDHVATDDSTSGRDAEVEDGNSAFGVDEHVLWLQVAVHDTGPVHTAKRFQEGRDALRDFGPAFDARSREGCSLNELHDQERGAVFEAVIQERNDTRKAKVPQRCNFTPHMRRPGIARRPEQLDGDVGAGEGVLRAIHGAGTTSADELPEPIASSDLLADVIIGLLQRAELTGGQRVVDRFSQARVQSRPHAKVLCKQSIDAFANVAVADRVQESGTLIVGALERLRKDALDLFPRLVGHLWSS